MESTDSQDRLVLPRAFLRMCRAHKKATKVTDSTGVSVTGEQLLLRTLILRRLLLRDVLAADESYVGLLLPPSTAGVIANAAVTLSKRIAVNLNYSVSAAVMDSCIQQAGIRHVLTSRKVLEKFPFQFKDVEPVFLEDMKSKLRWHDKAICALQAFLTPIGLLERQLDLLTIRPDDVMTIIFTSGSTGEPKGVVLTFENIGSNVRAINQIIHLSERDTVLGILPFFHSFGYTGTLWTILSLAPRGAYHFSPLDGQQLAKLCRANRATILMTAPTFLRTYIKRCDPADLQTLEVLITGAEKLPQDLADAFEAKFGVRPYQGYGTTETAPVAAVNIPASRATKTDGPTHKHGTVGLPLPGVQAKIVQPDSGVDLPIGAEGMLLIRGPNVMRGYLNKPELTAAVLRDGWYVTGDLARIDEDGFIEITGRQSRFSKIAGEMVPHVRVEEAIERLITRPDDEDGALQVAVTAVPDERKGERIIVVHTALPMPPEEICKSLAAAGLPNLWIPSPDSFMQVEQIPVLGSGKLDLKALKEVALSRSTADKRPPG